MEAKGVACELQIAPHLPPAAIDPERVAQIIRNLLNNALTHTPAGGLITVGLDAGEQRNQLQVHIAIPVSGSQPPISH